LEPVEAKVRAHAHFLRQINKNVMSPFQNCQTVKFEERISSIFTLSTLGTLIAALSVKNVLNIAAEGGMP
jgi:hypothetical protein